MALAKKGLGKGLGALLPPAPEPEAKPEFEDAHSVIEVDINKIEPNREQPRKRIDDAALEELASSLKEHGVIQPLVVKDEGDYYSIIVGERRWRAARMARLRTVPVIIRDMSEVQALEVAIVENIQRQNLNPIEQALSFKRLQDEFFLTQEAIAEKLGKSRNSITYTMALLSLPQRVQELLSAGVLSSGHGRALCAVKDADLCLELAERSVEEGLSVRELEAEVKQALETAEKARTDADKDKKDGREGGKPQNPNKAIFTRLEQDLKYILGTQVKIKDKNNKGKIEIEYYSNEELDRILNMFKVIKNGTDV